MGRAGAPPVAGLRAALAALLGAAVASCAAASRLPVGLAGALQGEDSGATRRDADADEPRATAAERAPAPPRQWRTELAAHDMRLLLVHYGAAQDELVEKQAGELLELLADAVESGLVPRSVAECRRALARDPWWAQVAWQRRQLQRLRKQLEEMERWGAPLFEDAERGAGKLAPPPKQAAAPASPDSGSRWFWRRPLAGLRNYRSTAGLLSVRDLRTLLQRYGYQHMHRSIRTKAALLAGIQGAVHEGGMPATTIEWSRDLATWRGVPKALQERIDSLRKKLDALQPAGLPAFPPNGAEHHRAPPRRSAHLAISHGANWPAAAHTAQAKDGFDLAVLGSRAPQRPAPPRAHGLGRTGPVPPLPSPVRHLEAREAEAVVGLVRLLYSDGA